MVVVDRRYSLFLGPSWRLANSQLDLETVAWNIPGTTSNIVFIFFVVIPAIILRDFCLTKHRGNEPPQCVPHVGQRLGLLNRQQLLSLQLCPCQATPVMLQPLWREDNDGLTYCHLTEHAETARRWGYLPPMAWTSQQCQELLNQLGSSRKGTFCFVLGLDTYFTVFGSVFLTSCSSLLGLGFFSRLKRKLPLCTCNGDIQPAALLCQCSGFPGGLLLPTDLLFLTASHTWRGNLWPSLASQNSPAVTNRASAGVDLGSVTPRSCSLQILPCSHRCFQMCNLLGIMTCPDRLNAWGFWTVVFHVPLEL